MRRGLTSLLAVAGLAVVAGCAGPADPEVTFYSHRTAVEVPPARYCDAQAEHCSEPNPDAVGTLNVPRNQPLQISVPGEVAKTPWQVAFIYRDAQGRELDSRSAVFQPGQRFAYTVRLPPDGVRLDHVEVQQFSALLTEGVDGGVDFVIGSSWVLDVE